MPLIMSLKKGQDFYIGDRRFIITDVVSDVEFTVRDEQTRRDFKITDKRSTEVMPDVFISAGEKVQTLIARVAVDAPPSLIVVRGDKYREPPPHIARRRGQP